jgi:RecQ-mediated genome instability protein 1
VRSDNWKENIFYSKSLTFTTSFGTINLLATHNVNPHLTLKPPVTEMAQPPTLQQLTHSLTTLGLPPPHPSFLQPILTTGLQKSTPLQGITATAKIRLLSADITLPTILLPSTPSFPPTTTDPKIPSQKLSTDILVQVLDVTDLSKSKWELIEALESERKGETTKGREIIRVVPTEDAGPSSASTQAIGTQAGGGDGGEGGGPFKIMMQDCRGMRVYGFELKRVEKIGYPPGMGIGCKILLRRGSTVARGMVLLEPERTTVLGGRIEGLDKAWREGREQRLRDQVERETRERNGNGNEDVMDED